MDQVTFVDTTLRDGQQSLWAMGMRTGMILAVATAMDDAGFEAIEIMGTASPKKLIRELHEEPWQRLDLVRERIRKTPLRVIRGRYLGTFQINPLAIEPIWYERLVAHGVRQIRISDSSNTASQWRIQVDHANEVGIQPIVNLIFSLSPRHTDEYYALKAREAAALNVHRICLKDPSGLLTPERTRTLVPVVLQNAGGIPVEFHTHCNTGLGPLCCLEAIKLGIRSINTAVPPLADGSSNPSVFNVARNSRALGYATAIDEERLRAVETHFREVATKNHLPVGVPAPYDAYHYLHQVPGGMISNLRHQLSSVGMADKLDAVLEEVGKVRTEFGFPIMVTPYSQFVGAQAMMNVMTGERYRQVSDEVIHYALGFWGADESASMDPDVKDKILNRSQARKLADQPPLEPSLKEMRQKHGGAGVSDDDFLLNYLAGETEVAAMRARPRAEQQATSFAHTTSRPMTETADSLSSNEVEHIKSLLQALEQSSLDFLQLEVGALKLSIGKGQGPASEAPRPQTTPARQAQVERAVAAASPAAPRVDDMAAPRSDGTVAVTAPVVGRFYSRPEPAAAPFVAVGSAVTADSTVGLIEVMKLFNSVSAGVAGTVMQVCVEDGQFVEYGQVLYRVMPAPGMAASDEGVRS
jgi:oxaloacetate decarboxylase alpha subunit